MVMFLSIGIEYKYMRTNWFVSHFPLQAKEYFEKAAENEDAGGHYNLGVLYLKGIGVKRDVKVACQYFMVAANAGQPKAFYQLAKMFHTGVGLKKDLTMVNSVSRLFFTICSSVLVLLVDQKQNFIK